MNHTILNIDKTNWKPVKFGEVVAEPKEICKDIVAEGIEHVVGLEHIDTGDVHLRKSATIEESTTFSKKFKKGDVLFGRRRAYLKKAAQADFDGICSGDITVFRVKKELSSALLPFIVNNDKFFDYAVKHSAGGLSPRVKFKDLANYEFLLPPKAEQARLAELLWDMDEVIEKEKKVLESFKMFKKSNIKKLYFGQGIAQSTNKTKLGYLPLGWEALKLANLTTLITKGTTPSSLGRSFEDKGINFIKIESITADGNYIKDKFEHIDDLTHEKLKRSQLQTDDILFSIAGALGRVAIVTAELCPANVNQALAIIRLKKGINAKFIIEYLRSEAVRLYIEKVHVKGAQPNLSLKDINELYVPIPPIKDQDRISMEVDNLIRILKTINSKLYVSQSLQKSLINQIF